MQFTGTGKSAVRKDIAGLKVGFLTVLHRTDRRGSQGFRHHWMCQCECGKQTEVHRCKLTGSKTTSCGCKRREVVARGLRLKHGMCRTPEFHSWVGMKGRCYNKNNAKYPNYGERGIRVCERWMESFENFFADMGSRPSPRHSVDRIDVHGDYSPENCRWALPAVQSDNKQRTIFLEYNGEVKTLFEWAKVFGIKGCTIRQRYKNGWRGEKLFSEVRKWPDQPGIVTAKVD